jgi:hypothetical protein
VIIGHVAISVLLHHYLDVDLGLATAAGVFPDATDKFLCQVLRVTPSGRMYGHSLLGVALSTLFVYRVWGRRAAGVWLLAYLGHLAADMDGFVPWLYPFRAYDFEGEKVGLFTIVRRVTRHPLKVGLELVLLIWALCALLVETRSGPVRSGTER